jgi:zinc D-Ala-D-Ala carboxypeptidase
MITRDQIEIWLKGIAQGVLVLDRDNEGMAKAALAVLAGLKPAPPPEPEPADDQLTEHFTLSELTYSDTAIMQGIDNTPPQDAIDQLAETADMLEEIRSACGNHPVTISSGYRCPELNKAVGGAANSAHLYGCAADFTIPAFGTPLAICERLQPVMEQLGIDQLIYEGTWVHVGRPIPPSTVPRCQYFTA